MVEPAKIERPTQLLVEGNDQKNFLENSFIILEFRTYKYKILAASMN